MSIYIQHCHVDEEYESTTYLYTNSTFWVNVFIWSSTSTSNDDALRFGSNGNTTLVLSMLEVSHTTEPTAQKPT
ncbi:hypothetical protein MUCCIDRAFT_113057 [Mucor lusitanicus CBS 277.49]|uniref:Uncharacterized protein n=1 Tax=Mucor lusitanicus CBS 277.49 TaxID=747725 RepID=A0A168JTJ1_MUCCL|nr:hypothetical protein MUCCIDRAFT_113057 [Mucor lusitanicus CBS 277.49]